MSIPETALIKARIAALEAAIELRTGQDRPEDVLRRARAFQAFLIGQDEYELGQVSNPGTPARARAGSG